MYQYRVCMFFSALASLAAAQCAGKSCEVCVLTKGCEMCAGSGGCQPNTTGCSGYTTPSGSASFRISDCQEAGCSSTCGGCSGSCNNPGCTIDCGGCSSWQAPGAGSLTCLSGGSSNKGVNDGNSLGAGIIVLIVFLVLLLIVLPAALAIAYFFCGCAICGRRRAKTVGGGAVHAAPAAPTSV